MSTLASFLSEVDGAPETEKKEASSSSSAATSSPHVAPAGKLVVSCCVDWDGMGGRGDGNEDLAVDGPHLVEIPGAPLVRKVFSSSTSHHMFILSETGELYAWGQNNDGQCGQAGGSIHWPVKISLPSAAVVAKVATGRSHTLLLLTDGRVFATGSNASGQLGLGTLAKGAKGVEKFTHVSGLELPCSDVSCGENHSMASSSLESGGQLYTWGHPLNGQLGSGTKGDFIKDGGKGAAVQFHLVPTPYAVSKYINKDGHGKVLAEYAGAQVRIRQVAAGKNHSLVLEDWENGGLGRVFSCGFGGYGRLGHNGVADELLFREVSFFSLTARDPTTGLPTPVPHTNPQRRIVRIDAGNTLSVAISVIGTAYNWGKLSNSKSGEAMVYPKLCDAGGGLVADPRLLANGSNLVVVGFGSDIVAWGAPVGGKLGLDGDVRSSVVPKYITNLEGVPVHSVCAGFGHVAYVVDPKKGEKLPEFKLKGNDSGKAKKQKTK